MAARSGLHTSAIRYYESIGLVSSARTEGNHRAYSRHALRRLAFIRAAQRVGLSLEDIGAALSTLPVERGSELERLRDDLSGCIGCGCLSLLSCRLYNPDDAASANGEGARFLLGDAPDQFLIDPG